MSTAKGFVQGYNAQAVANDEQVVVAAEVTCEHNDSGLLHPMIEATTASLSGAGIEGRPERLLADAGYASEENFAALDADGPDCYVATRNMKKNPTPRTGRRGPLVERRDADRPDGPEGIDHEGQRLVPAASADHRAGLRADQASPRNPRVQPARQGRSGLRVEADLRHPQPAQALPPCPCRPLGCALQPDRGPGHRLNQPQRGTATPLCVALVAHRTHRTAATATTTPHVITVQRRPRRDTTPHRAAPPPPPTFTQQAQAGEHFGDVVGETWASNLSSTTAHDRRD